jgi:hypothetical protein
VGREAGEGELGREAGGGHREWEEEEEVWAGVLDSAVVAREIFGVGGCGGGGHGVAKGMPGVLEEGCWVACRRRSEVCIIHVIYYVIRTYMYMYIMHTHRCTITLSSITLYLKSKP